MDGVESANQDWSSVVGFTFEKWVEDPKLREHGPSDFAVPEFDAFCQFE